MTPNFQRRIGVLRAALAARYTDPAKAPGNFREVFDFVQAGGGYPERLAAAIHNRTTHGSAFFPHWGKGTQASKRAWDLLIEPVFDRTKRGWRERGYSAPWVPCSQYFADYCQDCITPRPFPRGFAMGEATTSDMHTGENLYTCIRRRIDGGLEARIDSPRRLRAERQAA